MRRSPRKTTFTPTHGRTTERSDGFSTRRNRLYRHHAEGRTLSVSARPDLRAVSEVSRPRDVEPHARCLRPRPSFPSGLWPVQRLGLGRWLARCDLRPRLAAHRAESALPLLVHGSVHSLRAHGQWFV